MNRLLITTATLLIAATPLSCVTTGDGSNDSKIAGGAIGAVAGAVLGNQAKGSKKTRRNARLAGALVGGLLGGSIGHYMDKQEQELRQNLKQSGVEVVRNGEDIILNLPGSITFDSGKSSLNRSFHEVLGSVANVLNKYDKTAIQVAGHTDSTGPSTDNQILSEQRAAAVAGFLRRKGVENKRLLAVGFGESDPVSDNQTLSGRAANRRVEVTLVPLAH